MAYAPIIAGFLILALTFGIDFVHGKVRTGTVASVTESLGKLLIGTALTLVASLLFSGSAEPSQTWALLMVLMITLIILMYQAHYYSTQRDQTKQYLRSFVNEKIMLARTKLSPSTAAEVGNPILTDERHLTGDLVAELVDADFIPNSIGNKWSSFDRRRTRELTARWLTQMLGVEVQESDLIVPEKDRRGVNVSKFLSILLIVIPLLVFVGLFVSIWIRAGSSAHKAFSPPPVVQSEKTSR